MIKAFPFLILFVFFLTACQEKTPVSLAGFVDLEKIEKAEMSNNSGTFVLNSDQLSQLKKDLSHLTHCPNMSAKVGAIVLTLKIDGETHPIVTSTHGDYAEVNASMFDKYFDKEKHTGNYFKMNGVNFDNYKLKK